jgi:hypothetical protein
VPTINCRSKDHEKLDDTHGSAANTVGDVWFGSECREFAVQSIDAGRFRSANSDRFYTLIAANVFRLRSHLIADRSEVGGDVTVALQLDLVYRPHHASFSQFEDFPREPVVNIDMRSGSGYLWRFAFDVMVWPHVWR